MRVLHLLSSTGYHGAENMASELIRQLSISGVKSHLGVFFNNEDSNIDILSNVESYIENGVVFPCRGKINLNTILKLHRYIKSNKIDIIHSHKYKTNFYSLFAKFRTNCRLISTCHNWLGNSLNMKFYTVLDIFLLRAFDFVIGVSNEVTNTLKSYVPQKKILKIENGIDIKRFFKVYEKTEAKRLLGFDGKTLVGFVGRLSQEKGVSYLIEALQKLVFHKEDLYGLIVGEGNYGNYLKDYVNSLGISNKVIFTGNRKDTPLIYCALDVFVLPSWKEGFPIAVLEAMACGTPVIATKVGDIPSIIENNVSGIIINKKDANEIKEAIENLLSEPARADRMSEIAVNVAANKYTSEIMAQKYLKVYENILRCN